eukprot:gene1447-1788_t
MSPPDAGPVTIVLLHSEFSPDVFNQVSLLGPAFFVQGKPADPAALAAAGALNARSLVYLGPSERPTHVSAQSVSGVYGDPTLHPNDYNSTSRTAVLADAEALSCCYGVGEVLLPDTLQTVVELGFTSSIRFLQPGLLLHGHSAPHTSSSYEDSAGRSEGLTEWQGFFKRKALLDFLTELAGDDGRPGGAMLLQLPVPSHLVGCTYKELVRHFLTSSEPHMRHVPLGLLRKKAENRAWRLPYVATHPDPDVVLQMTDSVFVIRPQ